MKRIIGFTLIVILTLGMIGCDSNSGQNLFDNISTGITITEAYDLFGTEYDKIDYSSSLYITVTYQEMEFYGYKGTTELLFKTYEDYVLFKHYYDEDKAPLYGVWWEYHKGDETKEQYEKVIDTFIERFDKQYGEAEKNKNTYAWYDKSGQEIELRTEKDVFYVSLKETEG